jgi:hypothetical protein
MDPVTQARRPIVLLQRQLLAHLIHLLGHTHGLPQQELHPLPFLLLVVALLAVQIIKAILQLMAVAVAV